MIENNSLIYISISKNAFEINVQMDLNWYDSRHRVISLSDTVSMLWKFVLAEIDAKWKSSCFDAIGRHTNFIYAWLFHGREIYAIMGHDMKSVYSTKWNEFLIYFLFGIRSNVQCAVWIWMQRTKMYRVFLYFTSKFYVVVGILMSTHQLIVILGGTKCCVKNLIHISIAFANTLHWEHIWNEHSAN